MTSFSRVRFKYYTRYDVLGRGGQGKVLRTKTSRQPDASWHHELVCQAVVFRSGWWQLKCVCHGVATHGPPQTIRRPGLHIQSLFFFSRPLLQTSGKLGNGSFR